jgi:hypothetical protein
VLERKNLPVSENLNYFINFHKIFRRFFTPLAQLFNKSQKYTKIYSNIFSSTFEYSHEATVQFNNEFIVNLHFCKLIKENVTSDKKLKKMLLNFDTLKTSQLLPLSASSTVFFMLRWRL